MIDPVVQTKIAEIAAICQQFGVRRLELFGSAACGHFNPDRSDLDFLVEFDLVGTRGYADRYFGLLWGLEELFGRPIDLVDPDTIENPYLKRGIDESRTVLYAA